MAVDPRLQAQLDAMEHENALLDQQLAEKRKAQAEAPPRSLGQRFVDNVVDAFNRNPTVSALRNAFSTGYAGGAGAAPIVGSIFQAAAGAGQIAEMIHPGIGAEVIANEKQRRAQAEATAQADPFYKAPGGIPGKIAAGAATAAGALVGGAAEPTNYVVPGGSVVKRVAGQGAVSAVTDAAAQLEDMRGGLQDHFDPMRVVASAAVGAGLAGTLEGGHALVSKLFSRFHSPEGLDAPLSIGEANAVTPPVPAGHTRLYNGGQRAPDGSSAWFTSYLPQAQHYGDVSYVDLPNDHPILKNHFEVADQDGTPRGTFSGVLPSEIADTRKPYKATQAKPVRPRDEPTPETSPAIIPANDNGSAKEAPGAPKEAQATTLPAAAEKPAGDSPGGSQPGSEGASSGAQAGDPWKTIDWGKMRSKERAQAAQEHLDKLKAIIKPEHVQDFISALDRPEVAGQIGGGDRVGFINPDYVDWDKLDSNPEDLLQWTNIRAAIFKDSYDKAGDETRTWDQIDRASRLFGTNLSDLIKTHADITGEGGIAARVGALTQVALESADAFHAQLKDTRAAIERGDMSGVADFAASVQRTILLESMAEGSVSEVARALNYMRRLKRPKAAINDLNSILADFGDAVNGGNPVDKDTILKTMDNLDRAYKSRGSAGVVQEVAKMRQLGLSDYIGYSIIGGLLSAPKTAIRNLLGTPIQAVFEIGERYLGAGVGAARAAVGLGSKERMTFGEANAYVAAGIEALNDAFAAGWAAFKKGAPAVGGSWGGEVLERPIPFQLTKERIDNWTRNGFSFGTGLDMLGTAYFEVVRTLGFRPSVAADDFYKVINRRAQLAGLAYREAYYRSQVTGDPKSFQTTLKNIKQEPTAEAFKQARQWFLDRDMDPEAVYPEGSKADELSTLIRAVDLDKMADDYARHLAFQDGGPLVDKIDSALRMMPLIKWFYVPFFKTPIALMKAGVIDRNPATLGLLGKNKQAFARLIETAKNDEAALERGGAEADLAAARLMAGAGFMSFAFMLWANHMLVGRRGENGDPTKLDGIKEYSIKTPDGAWHQISSLDPIVGSLLGLVADTAQTLRDHPPGSDNEAMAVMGGVLAAVRNNILNKAALSGVKDFFDTYYSKGSEAHDKTGGSAVAQGLGKSLTSLDPLSSFQRNLAQEIDPTVRDARSLLDQFKAMTPGLSKTLPARRDTFGRPILRPPGSAGLFSTLPTSRLSDDPLDLEESRLAKVMPDWTLQASGRTFNGQPVTPAEYSRILEIQGQLYRDRRHGQNMEEAALDLIASDRYSSWPDERRAHELKDLVTKYREQANLAIKNPNSEFYMPEMVKRTAVDQIKKEVPEKGLINGRLRHRARVLGLSGEDLSSLETIFQQQ